MNGSNEIVLAKNTDQKSKTLLDLTVPYSNQESVKTEHISLALPYSILLSITRKGRCFTSRYTYIELGE